MPAEISGDGRLTFPQRLHYLAFNLSRNLALGRSDAGRRQFCSKRRHRTPATASPARALTEAFLQEQLPKLLPIGEISVLEIGCGSGSLTKLLAEIGYSGSYVGVDIADRFERAPQADFRREFVLGDATRFASDSRFDLVISVSALEHIPDDAILIQNLNGLVAHGGLQLHFVPSAWGLFTYLWHGYRQYTVGSLDRRFDASRTTLYSMGGASSFLLHFLFITVGEILLRLRLRHRLPNFYARLLDGSLDIDHLFHAFATMYAVCQLAEQTGESNHG